MELGNIKLGTVKRECLLGISEQEVLNKIIDIIEEKMNKAFF